MVEVNTLPPTTAAVENHSKRVFLQVQEWLGKADQFGPEEWGWICKNGKLFPATVSLPPAPESLLTVIRCSCKTNCESRRCNCRKPGLECSVACGECRGISCSNAREDKNNEDIFYDISLRQELSIKFCLSRSQMYNPMGMFRELEQN